MPERTANDRFIPPLIPFRFQVEFLRSPIEARGGGNVTQSLEALCEGAFSEVSGLDASLEPKAIKEGGMNYGAHQRAGQVNFSTVVLKRGMTSARDLWRWWALFAGAPDDSLQGQPPGGAYAHRLTVRITLSNANNEPQLKWRLERAMPVKFKAPDFNARATDAGIEELHLVHEGLFFEPVGGATQRR